MHLGSEEPPWLLEGMWSSLLLVNYLLWICWAGKEPGPASSAWFCDIWTEIPPDNLNPFVVCSGLMLFMKNLQIYHSHVSFCLFCSFFLCPVHPTCHQCTWPNFYFQLPGITWNYSLTDEKESYWHMNVVAKALENRYPSRSVASSFHKYPVSPRTATQWKRGKAHYTEQLPLINP